MSEFARDRRVDAVIIQLVRLVLDEDWSADGGATQLREHAGGPVLRRALARVRIANIDRPTPVSARATATLEAALEPAGIQTGQLAARDRSQRSGPPASNRTQAS